MDTYRRRSIPCEECGKGLAPGTAKDVGRDKLADRNEHLRVLEQGVGRPDRDAKTATAPCNEDRYKGEQSATFGIARDESLATRKREERRVKDALLGIP